MEPNWKEFSWKRVKRALNDLRFTIVDCLAAARILWMELTEPLWEYVVKFLYPDSEIIEEDIELYQGEEFECEWHNRCNSSHIFFGHKPYSSLYDVFQ